MVEVVVASIGEVDHDFDPFSRVVGVRIVVADGLDALVQQGGKPIKATDGLVPLHPDLTVRPEHAAVDLVPELDHVWSEAWLSDQACG